MGSYPEFARLLSQHLTKADRSVNWLARQLKRNASTVNRWLTEETRPSEAEVIKTILDLLAIDDPNERQALFVAADYPAQEGIPSQPDLIKAPSPHPPAMPLEHDFVAYDSQWVGRDELVQELTAELEAGRRLLLLTGMAGIGKTALAERIAVALSSWLPVSSRIIRLNFDHQERAKSFSDVVRNWLDELGEVLSAEERASDALLLRRLLQALSSERQLIIVDALEKITDTTEDQSQNRLIDSAWELFFHSILSAESLPSRVVVTSQDLPEQLARFGAEYPNRWLRKALTGLSVEEQQRLFHLAGFTRNGDKRPLAHLLRISQAYVGHPLALRTIIGEINSEFGGDVMAYWQEFGAVIERVEQDLAAARDAGQTQALDDWRLDRYSIELQRQVRHRLDSTFERLRQQAPDAYLLLCAAAVYRSPVKARFWLSQLAFLGKSEALQQAALQTLRDRSLLEQSIDPQGNRLLGLHNLIRSIALEHHQRHFAASQLNDNLGGAG